MRKLTISYLLLSLGYIAIAEQQEIQIPDKKDTIQHKSNTTRLEEVTILGSRGLPRTSVNTPVPIDIVNVNTLSQNVPQYTLGSLLNYVAPSFSSTPQTMGDGTDHIDPATLRGLGPDQTLVLVNGKRRYQTALVNVNGTVGRGSVGTDLNAIPVASIQNIEILRDGASAQYGSDAIAGVININLNKNIGKTYASASFGSNVTQYEAMQYPNIGDYANDILPQYDKKTAVDGMSYQFNVNHGFALSKKNPSNFINVGITYDNRAYTNRSGAITSNNGFVPPGSTLTADEWLASVGKTREDYRFRVGQSSVQNLQAMVNSNININATTDFYFFGGYGIRWGNSGGFYRNPFASNNNRSLYPYGFLPEINSRIQDYSFAFGFKGRAGEWLYDVSNTIGGNNFQYIISNTANISAMGTELPAETQTRFNAGGLGFLQNTTNVDFNRNFDILHNLNVAFGTEIRVDNYRQNAGEEASWANYQRYNTSTGLMDIYNGDAIHSILLANGATAVPAGGSQVFAGFTPANAVNKSRVAFGAYGEAALDVTDKFLIDGALRLEQYTDFGFNASGKLALRYKINKYIAIRGSGSNGFRAPSLQQQNYTLTTTQFVGSTLTQILTAPSTSQVVGLLGGQALKPELSYNGSLGITLGVQNLKFTLDGYYTYIQDRIILTRNFIGNANAAAGSVDKQIYDILISNNASSVAFFANGVNTQTYGIDGVLSYHLPIADQHMIDFDLSGTYSKTDVVGDVRTSSLLESKKHIYFDLTNINNMTKTFPRIKANFMLNYKYKNFSLFARESFVGPVTSVGSFATVGTVQYYYSQDIRSLFVTDLSLSYQIHKTTRLTIGVNNLFDIYPDKLEASKGKFLGVETNASNANYNKIVDVKNYQQMGSTLVANNNSITNNNQFNYPRSTTQIGLNGRYIFARLEINF